MTKNKKKKQLAAIRAMTISAWDADPYAQMRHREFEYDAKQVLAERLKRQQELKARLAERAIEEEEEILLHAHAQQPMHCTDQAA
jgi:hypothetical protein